MLASVIGTTVPRSSNANGSIRIARSMSRRSYIGRPGRVNRKIIVLNLVLLTIIGLTAGVFSAPQTLTKCKVQSKQLILQKFQKPFRLAGTVLSKGSNEYHLEVKSDLNAEIRLTANGHLRFDIYLLDPPTVITKSVDNWSGTFSSEKEYVLAVSNCSGKTSTTFKLEITSH